MGILLHCPTEFGHVRDSFSVFAKRSEFSVFERIADVSGSNKLAKKFAEILAIPYQKLVESKYLKNFDCKNHCQNRSKCH